MKFATFDIEAKNWIDFLALGFYDGINYIDFTGKNSISKFLDYLIVGDYKEWRIYSHYGGIYDHMFIIDEIFQRGLLKDLKIIINNQAVLKLELKIGKNKYKFMDSGLILEAGLGKLTKWYDVKHQKIEDIDRAHLEKYSMATIREYLKFDTIGLYEVLTKFYNILQDNLNISPSLTLASTGMLAFQPFNKYNITPIKSEKLDEFIRKGYYGGRVEIYKTFGEDLYYYDFNSLYPSMMLDNYIPIGKYIYISDDWEKYYNGYRGKIYRGVGYFEIEAPDIYIPLLPLRYDGKLYFPIGNFKGYYTFTEIKKAIEYGYKCKFLGGYMAVAVKDLFTEFVDTVYNKLRVPAIKSDNLALNHSFKKILNANSGKWAEHKIKTEILFSATHKDFKKGNLEIFSEGEPLIYKRPVHSNREYHNVGITAEITSLSRIRLFTEINNILKMGYSVYYDDTDSIITNCPPDKLKVDKYKLGYLKCEHKIIEGIFLTSKFYFLKIDREYDKNILKLKKDKLRDYIFIHKGFKNIKIPYDEFKILFNNQNIEKICTKYEGIAKFKSSIKRKEHIIKRTSPFLCVVETKKQLRNFYDKRFILSDRINTTPIKFLMGG